MKNNKGITLIALVITIIVLIILAGVAINLTLGENGILRKSEEAKLKYEIAQAEEELDLKIVDLQAEKQGTATLQDLVDVLKNEEDMDYIVSLEEIASITGVETIGNVDEIYVVYKIYQFRVDDKLQTEFISIVESYTADVAISSTLKSHDGKNEDEKYLATFEIKVESQGQVQSIEIETVDGKITETPTSLPYTKQIQVEIGQKYIVKVTTPDGKYKRYVIEEKAEETIKTAAELAAFRDKVNSGLTYEGKTVRLANDNGIDLSSVCGVNVNGQEVSWEPIGKEATPFKGIFDGGYKTISNIYINSTETDKALFGYNMGTITKVQLDGGYIKSSTKLACLCANMYNGIIENCITKNIDTIVETNYVAGICAYSYESEIKSCINLVNLQSTVNSNIGGIAGVSVGGKIENCYNGGKVTAPNNTAGGIAGFMQKGTKVNNSYNYGVIQGSKLSGGITGANGNANTAGGTISNCYYLSNTSKGAGYGTDTATKVNTTTLQGYASTLGDAFTSDIKIKVINKETGIEEEVWSNGGYPILKWQIGE